MAYNPTHWSDLLDHLSIRYSTTSGHGREGWLQIDCPFCGSNTGKWHMGINEAGGYSNCWRCGYHSVVETLCEATNRETREILALLTNIQKTIPKAAEKKTGKLVIPKNVENMKPPHRRYLKGRGYDPDTIVNLWGVRGISISSRLSWRLWIPITYQHEVVSWTTRTIGQNKSRYISADTQEEAINHKHLLYGEDMAHHAIIIVEGPTDVWRIGPGAVALLGLIWSSKQIQRMKQYPVRVVCFDNEHLGRRAARKLSNILSVFPGETYEVTLSGTDPASSPDKEIRELQKRFL